MVARIETRACAARRDRALRGVPDLYGWVTPFPIGFLGAGIPVAVALVMLKLLGSYALAKLLGFGLIGAIVIYALLSLLT